jgi:predicted metal-dependent peptidase
MKMSPERRIQRARIQLSFKQPFFSSLLFNCNIIDVTKSSLPGIEQVTTMATDGRDIFYSPDFVEQLDDKNNEENLQGVLCHEVMHKVFMHCEASKGRDNRRFNVAADYIINDFIIKAGMTLPDGCLIDPAYTYEDWSSDAVYEDIVRKLDDKTENPNHLIGHGSASESQEAQEERKTQMDQQVAAARDAQQRQKGSVPDCINKLVDDLIKPKVDWRAKLREFVQMTGKNDVTWRKPNRRFAAHGLYLPVLESEECPHLCIVFDTSGSIYCNEKTAQSFVSEVNAIIEDIPPEKITVLHTDTKVAYETELDAGEPISGEFHGGGGTDFNAVMDHITQLETAPAAVIFFTDLYCGDDFGVDPGVPVHWIVYENSTPTAPFGEITIIED